MGKISLKSLIRQLILEEVQQGAQTVPTEAPVAETPPAGTPAEAQPPAPETPPEKTDDDEVKELVSSLEQMAESKQDLSSIVKLTKAAIQQRALDDQFLKKLYKAMLASDNILINQAADRNIFLFPNNVKEK